MSRYADIDLITRELNENGFYELEKIPTVDAVPVVRCKDCKYFNPHVMECEGIGKWFGLEGEWGANDYCSKAERKDDE